MVFSAPELDEYMSYPPRLILVEARFVTGSDFISSDDGVSSLLSNGFDKKWLTGDSQAFHRFSKINVYERKYILLTKSYVHALYAQSEYEKRIRLRLDFFIVCIWVPTTKLIQILTMGIRGKIYIRRWVFDKLFLYWFSQTDLYLQPVYLTLLFDEKYGRNCQFVDTKPK